MTGLTNKQRDVLRCFDEDFRAKPVTLCILCQALAERQHEHDWVGWDSGNIYSTLQRLQRRGLVARTRLHDGSYWRITESGEAAWREAADVEMSPRAEERTIAALGRLRELAFD